MQHHARNTDFFSAIADWQNADIFFATLSDHLRVLTGSPLSSRQIPNVNWVCAIISRQTPSVIWARAIIISWKTASVIWVSAISHSRLRELSRFRQLVRPGDLRMSSVLKQFTMRFSLGFLHSLAAFGPQFWRSRAIASSSVFVSSRCHTHCSPRILPHSLFTKDTATLTVHQGYCHAL